MSDVREEQSNYTGKDKAVSITRRIHLILPHHPQTFYFVTLLGTN